MRLGEVPVALVLSGHRHDRPGAVGHEDVVGQEDGDGHAGEGVHDPAAGGDTALVQGCARGHSVDLAAAGHLRPEGVHVSLPVRCGQLVDTGVFRRDDGERDAEGGVGTRGEHHERFDVASGVAVIVGYCEAELGTFGASDPVALHDLDLFGPVHGVHVVQELLGVVGDPVEPLLHVAALDQVSRAFAGAVAEYLLVGQHGLAAGTPVDRSGVAVDEAGFVELQEDPLRPAHVGRIVAADHASPVVDRADATQRSREGLDVGFGVDPRVGACLDGGVLGR